MISAFTWARQLEERMAAGPAWHGHDLVFCWSDGRAIHPTASRPGSYATAALSSYQETGPHGLRHSYATAALRAGVGPHVISKRLGHADVATTLSIYSHVLSMTMRRLPRLPRMPSSVCDQIVITVVPTTRDLRDASRVSAGQSGGRERT